MSPLFLIRARLKESLEVRALAESLLPSDENARLAAEHRLMWSLMAQHAGQKRDFLYRAEAPGKYLILAARKPASSLLFDVDEPKAFAPLLSPGDRLGFVLRANATVSVNLATLGRGKREDVVTRAMRELPREQRADQRRYVVAQEGESWLRRQGERDGFIPLPGLEVEELQPMRLPRRGKGSAMLGKLDFSGGLTVTDTACFVAAVARGFGRGRAFGLGLMLLRRI